MAFYCGGSASSSGTSITVNYKANTSGTWTWNYNVDQDSKTSAENYVLGSWTSKDSGTMSKTLSVAGTPSNTLRWGSISALADSVVTYYFKYYTPPAAPVVSASRSYSSAGTIIYLYIGTPVGSGSALSPTYRVFVNGTQYYSGSSTSPTITVPFNGSSSATMTVYAVTSASESTTSSNKGTATLSCNYSVPSSWTGSLYPSYPYYHYLSYNANGGSGAPGTQSAVTYGSTSTTFTVSSTIPTRNGWTFLGWSTSSQASAVDYFPGDSITVGAGTTTLYAVWRSPLTITANIKGNTVTGRPYVKINGVWKLATTGFRKTGGEWKEDDAIDLRPT